jgi:2-polyprenyl-6-hydroxyphenyl methylase / 3-demethylubiquinone-9 3-methyltransferase
MLGAGLVPGAINGVDPQVINRRLDLTFGPMPLTCTLYMGVARKPAAVEAAA